MVRIQALTRRKCGITVCVLLLMFAWTLTSALISRDSLKHARQEIRMLEQQVYTLTLENRGLEASITKEALRAYCKVECGSCITTAEIVAALTRPNPLGD